MVREINVQAVTALDSNGYLKKNWRKMTIKSDIGFLELHAKLDQLYLSLNQAYSKNKKDHRYWKIRRKDSINAMKNCYRESGKSTVLSGLIIHLEGEFGCRRNGKKRRL